MRKWKQKIRRAATEWLALPPDALMDVSRLTCIQGSEVVVENMRSLIHVSDTLVELEVDNARLRLQGQHFVVTLVAENEIHVQGSVDTISYLRQKEGRL